jgi:hypothetical protein
MAMAMAVCAVWAVDTGADTPGDAPALRSGAIELGLAGSLVTVEGIVSGSGTVRGGVFKKIFGGLGAFEADAGYTHVSSLDELELEGAVSWQRRVGATSNYPYVSVGGGIRYMEVGSFDRTRYPFGFGLGLRSLLGKRAGVRVEYRFRRVMNDPVSNFSEHRLMLGLSVFFRNQ